MKRRPCERDANHNEIVRFARSVAGCVVVDTHEVGPRCIPGFPDALLLWRGAIIPIEIKTQNGVETKSERDLAAEWATTGVRVRIVRVPADVLDALGLLRPARV